VRSRTSAGFRTATTLAGGTQTIPGGPVASMEAIKLLGTNGGSFYGVGGAHPFENPTGFTNMFDLLLVIVLPFAIAFMFGRLIGKRRQGYAIVAVMAILFLGHTVVSMQAEVHGNHSAARQRLPGGERQQPRREHGGQGGPIRARGLCAHDRRDDGYHRRRHRLGPRQLHPCGRAGAFVGILLGEVSPGGDGGRPVQHARVRAAGGVRRRADGRANAGVPGQEDPGPQMKLIIAYVLTIPIVTLVFGSISLVIPPARARSSTRAFTACRRSPTPSPRSANNNGSAFAGLAANTDLVQHDARSGHAHRAFRPDRALTRHRRLSGRRTRARANEGDARHDWADVRRWEFLLGVIVIVGWPHLLAHAHPRHTTDRRAHRCMPQLTRAPHRIHQIVSRSCSCHLPSVFGYWQGAPAVATLDAVIYQI
jgi:hypothetical protein